MRTICGVMWPVSSKWLGNARFDRGLLFPGRSWRGRGADLLLGSEGAVLAHNHDRVLLDWGDHSRWRLDDHWSVGAWARGRGFDIGVGLHVSGRYLEQATPMRRRTTSIWDRWVHWFDETEAVALWPLIVGRPGVTGDVALVQVLCETLAERPDVRERLNDPERVRRLVADMVHTRHTMRWVRTGARRRVVEVLNSMHLLGYEHARHGRPLPDGSVPSLEDVTARVLDHIRGNRYAQGLEISEEFVRNIVERDYTGVAPWPLRALLD